MASVVAQNRGTSDGPLENSSDNQASDAGCGGGGAWNLARAGGVEGSLTRLRHLEAGESDIGVLQSHYTTSKSRNVDEVLSSPRGLSILIYVISEGEIFKFPVGCGLSHSLNKPSLSFSAALPLPFSSLKTFAHQSDPPKKNTFPTKSNHIMLLIMPFPGPMPLNQKFQPM